MKIVSFNVNSVRARCKLLAELLQKERPDIVLLQEIKCREEFFPNFPGYRSYVLGQKAYHGVAILLAEKLPKKEKVYPQESWICDKEARFLGIHLPNVTVASLYVPNGAPLESEKYTYKLRWLECFEKEATQRLRENRPIIYAGDYNIIPGYNDAYDPEKWFESPLGTLEVRNVYRRLYNAGYSDAIKLLYPHHTPFTYWDYSRLAFEHNRGIRLDHFLLSPEAANHLESAEVITHFRAQTSPSDHAPVAINLTSFKI